MRQVNALCRGGAGRDLPTTRTLSDTRRANRKVDAEWFVTTGEPANLRRVISLAFAIAVKDDQLVRNRPRRYRMSQGTCPFRVRFSMLPCVDRPSARWQATSEW